VHLLSGLEVGGKERIALRLARRARCDGLDHTLCLFDRPFRGTAIDLDPGDVPWVHLPRRGGLDCGFVTALARFLERERPDAVHAHNDSALVYAVLAHRRLRGARPHVVATFHTRPSHPTLAGRILCRWASQRAFAVTAVSRDLHDHYRDQRWLARSVVLWNGVDVGEYRPDGPRLGLRARLGVGPGELLVGHVGRFHPVKRQHDLLGAVRALRARGHALRCVFVGDGPGRAEFARLLDGDAGTTLLPKVDDMSAFYRELDLFVQSSVEEAAALVLLEAMATGLAIVSTHAGSSGFLLDAAGASPCARMVPMRNPDAIAAALAELAADPALRAELGRRARHRAEALFSAEREWQQYAGLYRGDPVALSELASQASP
jgi:glycosyltransferase involved in cell wall biosynthesis